MNPQMFNSFVDGTKSSIEMAAISNATGLKAPRDGLLFPPCGVDDLPTILRPRDAGGLLEEAGQVEVVSSLERDGRPVFRDLRWGVYVVIEADPSAHGDYARRCFREYGMATDPSGRYTALYRPYHMIGLELGISVAAAALRNEATGAPIGFFSDAVAVAKKDLMPGEMWLYRVGPHHAGGGVPCPRCPAHRPRPQGAPHPAHRPRRSGRLGGRGDRRQRHRTSAPGDGAPVRRPRLPLRSGLKRARAPNTGGR
jgi:hypothetical protein